MSIYDTSRNIDRGPEESRYNVFEIKIRNRMLTLYSDENILFEKFVICLTKVLELKNQILDKQKKDDLQLI